MLLNATFNNISVISWRLCSIGRHSLCIYDLSPDV